MEKQYVVYLNGTIIVATDDYNEAKESFDKQVKNWQEHYKDKVIENDDVLTLFDYYNQIVISRFCKLDLL